MCFLSVTFCIPFPLLSNFHFPSSSLSADKCSLYHWEKRSSQKRTSPNSPRISSHFTASRPIYSVFSSIEDKLFIRPTKASPTIHALNPISSYLLNDVAPASVHSLLCIIYLLLSLGLSLWEYIYNFFYLKLFLALEPVFSSTHHSNSLLYFTEKVLRRVVYTWIALFFDLSPVSVLPFSEPNAMR